MDKITWVFVLGVCKLLVSALIAEAHLKPQQLLVVRLDLLVCCSSWAPVAAQSGRVIRTLALKLKPKRFDSSRVRCRFTFPWPRMPFRCFQVWHWKRWLHRPDGAEDTDGEVGSSTDSFGPEEHDQGSGWRFWRQIELQRGEREVMIKWTWPMLVYWILRWWLNFCSSANVYKCQNYSRINVWVEAVQHPEKRRSGD